jgi:class 3 adenylate cyclase
MAHSWTTDRSTKRIKGWLEQVKTVTIKEYVRDTSLNDLAVNTAYKVDGVHLYVDILNIKEMLATTEDEGVTCHRRTLRFLNLHFRAVQRILSDVDAIEVDFHNQRLHAVFVKPYASESDRVHRAIATAQLVIDVLKETGEGGEDPIPSAEVRVGIDTGVALAVNNGRRGHREPLFLGEPANRAAKRAAGGSATGIYLTNTARDVVDLELVDDEDATALTAEEVQLSEEEADLDVTKDDIVKAWKADLEANPIGRFEFTGHTPPYGNLDLDQLSPANSRRQDIVSVYADLDGFTDFVRQRIDDDDTAKDVVRVLHVVRSELDAALVTDFGGLKVRFVGDCIHGVLAEGTAQTTDDVETVSTATLAAGALRSGFELAIEKLEAEGYDADDLGLAVGFELGPLALSRLGMKGALVRCAVGRNVLQSEKEQGRCGPSESAIGPKAYNKASEAVRKVFGATRKRADLDYDTAADELSKEDDKSAKESLAMVRRGGAATLLRAAAVAPPAMFPPNNAAPTKPRGYA